MGLVDVSPPHIPSWVVPTSFALLAAGALCWDATYVLLAFRSRRTHSYGMPLLALALNISWEIIFAIGIAEQPLERIGFLAWLLLDIPILQATIRAAPREFSHAPLVACNIVPILASMVVVGCAGNAAFAYWFFAVPGRGSGDKAGKWWRGAEGYDCTELAFWTAGIAQLTVSAGCLAMLVERGHSGGTSYAIWFTRSLGTLLGWIGPSALLWCFWPEAHGFFVNPVAVFIMATCLTCDMMYPMVLAQVRLTEVVLFDGSIVAGGDHAKATHAKMH
ncbi:hypothetical protein BN1723_004366 [Verticillium longisporum]|uniref:Uncharacterized protein n=2 Tax=Verticillium longisporum TaxID=100787 RepID=A0A0G4MVP7_VERLO|nr:Terpene cyclase ascF like protein [Verticillium longisporum]CRK38125.1 hypothetical protein BN1723_004366 [Verticillium longisporum]